MEHKPAIWRGDYIFSYMYANMHFSWTYVCTHICVSLCLCIAGIVCNGRNGHSITAPSLSVKQLTSVFTAWLPATARIRSESKIMCCNLHWFVHSTAMKMRVLFWAKEVISAFSWANSSSVKPLPGKEKQRRKIKYWLNQQTWNKWCHEYSR